jgi:hypothetical protein
MGAPNKKPKALGVGEDLLLEKARAGRRCPSHWQIQQLGISAGSLSAPLIIFLLLGLSIDLATQVLVNGSVTSVQYYLSFLCFPLAVRRGTVLLLLLLLLLLLSLPFLLHYLQLSLALSPSAPFLFSTPLLSSSFSFLLYCR